MTEFELKADFAREVLEESMRVPVLVDFWAPWCGPCRVLSPSLEKLAREAKGAWKLVTVNTDANPELAQVLRVRSIPTVFLFDQGQPVGTFSGALPEKDLREWLRRYLPESGEGPEPSRDDAAAAALGQGRVKDAKRILAKAIQDDPKDEASRLLYARVLFPEDLDQAIQIVSSIPEESENRDAVDHYRRLRDLFQWERGKAARAVSGPAGDVASYRAGIKAASAGRYEEAVETWLELIGRNRDLDEDGARKALVALLFALGDEHPLTRDTRRRLANLLF